MTLSPIFKTTAVRLTLVYGLLFGLLAVGTVLYISYSSGQIIIQQVRNAAEEEIADLARVYRFGGAARLIRSIERRSRNPGSNLYLVSDSKGRIITGNVRSVAPDIMSEPRWVDTPFAYQPFAATADSEFRAIAQIFKLDNGLNLLVGRDIADALRFRQLIFHSLFLALLAMLVTGVVLWFAVGRRALQKMDRINRASARIVDGDLSQRLPITRGGDEFDRLSGNLNNMIAKVERLNTGLTDMSDSIAHDLRTPLSRIRNAAEALQLSLSSQKEKSRDAADAIVREADNLIATFDALLMISQVNSGARSVSMAAVDMGQLTADVVDLFQPSFDDAGLTLTHHVDDTVSINGNRELLALAVSNLLDNALKYVGDEGQSVRCLVSANSGFATIAISDDGPGIPARDRDRVKDRFVRLETDRSKPGSGLGLATVDAICRLHGGDLQISSNDPGTVVTMRIALPSGDDE